MAQIVQREQGRHVELQVGKKGALSAFAEAISQDVDSGGAWTLGEDESRQADAYNR